MTGTRRERARQQKVQRRLRYARVGFVGLVILLMLAPSLRAPHPVTGASGQGARAADDPLADDPLAGAGAAAAAQSPPSPLTAAGTLRAPKIGLETSYYLGLHPTTLERGPGHWPGTPLPGEPGNAVVSGHRTAATAPFGGLDLLTTGDEVRIAAGGVEIVYHVFETLIVDAEAYVDVVLAQPAGPADRVLTMFACHPKGSSAQRIVVRARVLG